MPVSKHRRKKVIQAIKLCMFCNQPGSSKEHVFGDWLNRFFPQFSYHEKNRVEIASLPDNKLWINKPIKGSSSRQGDIFSQKISHICKSCNNTWMSVIENNAKEALLPLLNDQSASLNQPLQRTIAMWALLKSIVAEYTDMKHISFSSEEKYFLFKENLLPPRFQVYLGHMQDNVFLKHYAHRGFKMVLGEAEFLKNYKKIHLPEKKINPEQNDNWQTTLFGFGRLVIYTYNCNIDLIALDQAPRNIAKKHGLAQIWPIENDNISWPPKSELAETHWREISNAIISEQRDIINDYNS